MRFCKYCGNKVGEEEKICPACGKNISPAKRAGGPDSTRVTAGGPDSARVTAGGPDSVRGTAGEPDSAKVKAGEADSGTGQYSAGTNPGAIQQKNSLAEGKKRYLIIAAIAAAAVLLAVLSLFSGRCRADACNNKKAPGSDYCYNHKCNVPDCRNQRLSFSNYCYEHYDLYDDDAKEENGGAYSWELNISDVRVYSEYSFTYAEGTLKNNSDSTVKYVRIKGAFKTRMGTVVDTDWTYAVGSEGLAPGESCKWKMSVTKDSSITDCDVTILESK